MKYQTEFRSPDYVEKLSKQIKAITTQEWKIMEICGGQTHSIAKFGLFDLLPDKIELIHGPGCPVCVTPKRTLDHAMDIASNPKVIFCTFGDMLRVPGSREDLLALKAKGADIRMIYSPLEVIELALNNKDKEVILFAVGFETTAPMHAMAIKQAAILGLKNFSVLTSLVLVPPAMEYILQSPLNQVQGFLAAGHVCTIMGDAAYYPIAKKYHVPIIITGFEPVDILQGILHCVLQLEKKIAIVENQYTRLVHPQGNSYAKNLLAEVFDETDSLWRGIGNIAKSAFVINEKYAYFDANNRFPIRDVQNSAENAICISGEILQGLKKPSQCPAFKKACTPETPLGAPMVSTEGACAAYFRYSRDDHEYV
ncbi:MAG: hydrogenase formation protein HypD [Proteobacteria bacterium]|nr:hydrogenase formation protein HypD [Pseudomonadota bacterium]